MKVKAVERIGIFGGTFNPPHLGHLLIAEHARQSASLNKVLFVPAFLPPHKVGREIIDSKHRLAMTKLAIAGNRSFIVSDIEMRQRGISYTVGTLHALRAAMPQADLFLIMGSDSLAEVDGWKDPQAIRSLVRFLVYPRDDVSPSRNPDVEFIRGPVVGISSSEIRGRAARGESIRYLVPQSVERYILRHRLYRR